MTLILWLGNLMMKVHYDQTLPSSLIPGGLSGGSNNANGLIWLRVRCKYDRATEESTEWNLACSSRQKISQRHCVCVRILQHNTHNKTWENSRNNWIWQISSTSNENIKYMILCETCIILPLTVWKKKLVVSFHFNRKSLPLI